MDDVSSSILLQGKRVPKDLKLHMTEGWWDAKDQLRFSSEPHVNISIPEKRQEVTRYHQRIKQFYFDSQHSHVQAFRTSDNHSDKNTNDDPKGYSYHNCLFSVDRYQEM